jgi:hypothetical protein
VRNYEGVVGLAETKDPILRRNIFVIDRYLRLLDAAGFASGQPTNTGASGNTHGEGCCPNQVDEFERVHDATEGILSFGRATELASAAPLSGHTITRIEGGELNTIFNLNGDTTAGAVTFSTTTVRTGTYSILITKGGAAAANFSLALFFDADGQTASTGPVAACAWRAWIRFSALPDAARQIISIRSGATIRSQLNLSNTGILTLDGVSGTTVLAINTWYELTGVFTSASTGSHSIRISEDGRDRTQEFSNVTPVANGTVLNILFGSTSVAGTYTMFVDDIMLEAGASTSVVDYPPPGGVYAIPLSADGAIADVWGLTGAATRWQACTAPHDAASFIAVTGTGDRNQSFLQTPQAAVTHTINCAQFGSIVGCSTAGNYNSFLKIAISNAVAAGSLTSLTAGAIGGATALQNIGSLQQNSNFTLAPWTEAELEGMVIVAHAAPSAGGQTVSVYTLATQVDVGPAATADFARAIRVTAEDGHVIPAYLVADGSAVNADSQARLVAGYDGTNAQILLTDTSGRLVTVGGGGITVDLADDAAFTVGTSRVVPMGAMADETGTDSVDEGDIGVPRMTLDRKLLIGSELSDDAAFTIASSKVNVIGFLADETATDSVDEGDVGAARMTLDRRIITSSELIDDAAFGIGTARISGTGLLADETGTDSVDEGDIGIARMTLDRRAHVKNTDFSAGAALGDTDANPTTTKVGAVTMFRNEGTTTLSRASGETHATDELGNTDDAGVHVSDIHKSFVVTLTNVSTAYDTNPETQTSASTDCRRFRYAILSFTLDSTGTPTDILFDVEMSPDNSNFYKIGWGFLQDLRYDDTVCATAINESILIEKLDRYVRLVVTATGGTGAGTKFDVTNAKITFFN